MHPLNAGRIFLLFFLLLSSELVISKFHDKAYLRGDDDIDKRGSVQFFLMILQVTGRNPFDYNGYGCYCGLGGKGNPVDGTDRCCYFHDRCYNALHRRRRKVCRRYQVYYQSYRFLGTRCYTGWRSSRCGRALCHCDAAAVRCYKRERFNRRYMHWPQSRC